MSSDELSRFIVTAKTQGVGDETIVALLKRNGWSERRIFGALSTHYASAFGEPVPTRGGQQGDARAAFFYLLDFITLGCWTVAIGQIFYVLIAHWLPDLADRSLPYTGQGASLRDQLSWQAATVIVTFPLFLFVHRSIANQLRTRPDLYDSGVRKWLTYVALVIAAIVTLSDGVWFLYELIRGELTLRFCLDAVVLLVLAGGVFVYYLATVDGPVRRSE